VSTRGSCPPVGFDGALLGGLAPDGGLFVPESWPSIDVHPSADRYVDVAVEVLAPYVAPVLARDELHAMVEDAYSTFTHPDVCPVRPLGDVWLLELFWGPTLAFKDVALQLVGRMMDRELTRRDERATILVATSGDTGSAAIEACRGRERVDIVVLHPAGRVSEVQRRQMTTVDEPNVHNVAVDGDFDTCQDLVKAAFADAALRRDLSLSAMNSINWARVMAQVVYYVTSAAAVAPDGSPVSFSVPTGNFGNVLAGWVAAQGGLPVDRLVVGSNRNDVLTRWIDSGVMELHDVEPSLSPSMDIQVSSNVERYLWELYGRSGTVVAEAMADLRAHGRLDVGEARMERVRSTFAGVRVDDDATLAEIARVHAETGVLVDPHTAVALVAAREVPSTPGVPRIVLSTAHPAKFPDAVERATGIRPALPDHLADLLDRPERLTPLPADPDVLADFLRSTLLAG
jgi:threonine synthase